MGVVTAVRSATQIEVDATPRHVADCRPVHDTGVAGDDSSGGDAPAVPDGEQKNVGLRRQRSATPTPTPQTHWKTLKLRRHRRAVPNAFDSWPLMSWTTNYDV